MAASELVCVSQPLYGFLGLFLDRAVVRNDNIIHVKDDHAVLGKTTRFVWNWLEAQNVEGTGQLPLPEQWRFPQAVERLC